MIISTPNKTVSSYKNPFHFKEYSQEEFLNLLNNFFPKIELFGQKIFPKKYILFINSFTQKIKRGFVKWFISNFLRFPFRNKEILKLGKIGLNLLPVYFIAICYSDYLSTIFQM
ncbi:hypothetical protein GYA19_00865 [Candidatus Beckwithbacteria bacterium]|nr:hypothetical protein [Candidatus Beckwithbacteria bacterium]